MNQNVLKVQRRLAELGYNVGPLDGIRGRRVIAAVKSFQRDNGLVADGLVGRNTYAALFTKTNEKPVTAPTDDFDATPWMDEAYRVMGLHETRNKKSIWNWLKSDGASLGDPAKNPWCGDFCQTAMALSMPEEPIPANPYLALNWTKFGKPCKPQFGAVLVFWRGSPKSWKGHVGFYAGETNTHFKVLGGNQSNAVTHSLIAKNRIRKNGVRWPTTALPATGKRIAVNGKGLKITTNEA